MRGHAKKTRTPSAVATTQLENTKTLPCQKKRVSLSTPTCKRQPPSFRSRNHTQEQGNTAHPGPRNKAQTTRSKFQCGHCLLILILSDTAAQFIDDLLTPLPEPMSQLVNSIPGFHLTNLSSKVQRLVDAKLLQITNSPSDKTSKHFQKFSNKLALIQTWITS